MSHKLIIWPNTYRCLGLWLHKTVLTNLSICNFEYNLLHFVIKLVILLHCNVTAAVLSDWLTECIIRFADLNSDYRHCHNQSYVHAVAMNTCATFWSEKVCNVLQWGRGRMYIWWLWLRKQNFATRVIWILREVIRCKQSVIEMYVVGGLETKICMRKTWICAKHVVLPVWKI